MQDGEKCYSGGSGLHKGKLFDILVIKGVILDDKIVKGGRVDSWGVGRR